MIYPWQKDIWSQFIQYLDNSRLPHSLLLAGPSGLGKLEFCLSFIKRMNCKSPTAKNEACDECKDCKLFLARTHPDIFLINVDENSDQIKIDEIRELNHFMTLSRQQGQFKVVCINQAENMNINAANAILKTLEEPPENSTLILVSHRIESLLPTIRSRCQIWKFKAPETKQALGWLNQHNKAQDWETLLSVSGNRPIHALALKESGLGDSRAQYYASLDQIMLNQEKVTKISAKLQNEELETLVIWQQSWCSDLVRCYFKKEPMTLENPDIRRSLHSLVGRVDLQSLFQYMEKLIEFRRFSRAPLNKRLFVEDMLIRCQEIVEQPI